MFIKEVTNLNDGVIYFNGSKIFEGDIATKECFDTIYKAATYDNPDIYDSIYKYVEEYAPDIIWEYRKKSNDVYMEYHDDIIDIFHELLANDFVNNEYDEESGFNSFGDNVDGLEWFIKDEEVTESLTIKEQSANIEVENPGILEVPEGKNVEDLPIKHFVALADKKGLSTITRALNNLQVWNKNKNPKLSKWAGDMIDKVTKRFENQKKESVNRLHIKEEYEDNLVEDYKNDLKKFADTNKDELGTIAYKNGYQLHYKPYYRPTTIDGDFTTVLCFDLDEVNNKADIDKLDKAFDKFFKKFDFRYFIEELPRVKRICIYY